MRMPFKDMHPTIDPSKQPMFPILFDKGCSRFWVMAVTK